MKILNYPEMDMVLRVKEKMHELQVAGAQDFTIIMLCNSLQIPTNLQN